ncbi:NAD-dependent aldehyde dehydrogenase [Leptolyngbya sp. PCC 7375]|nr:NAD-dependent aldehyde dehydrogenase [Leptolyngbya sp. PCC 7375]
MTDKLWIGGEWIESQGGTKRTIENPATGNEIAHSVDASDADVEQAVQSARTAFFDGRWSRKTPAERSLILWRLANLLEARGEEFARVESENTGKPYSSLSLKIELPFIVDNLRFFAAAARDTHGASAGEYAKGYTSLFLNEPVGVVGQITPWNYPLMMAVWKMAPALAAGCTVVLKPAPTTPLTTLMLAELSAEAGLPPGVLNVVTGGNQTGQAIVAHPDVRMVSLTGSTATGKKIMRTAADTLKRVHLELGGKAPFIVLDDADVATVAAQAIEAATVNTGQDCTAATRVYVSQSRFVQVQEAIVESMRQIKLGLPFEPDVTMGPLISGIHQERVQGFVERAIATGARILTGGKIPQEFSQGYFFEPTVIVDVDQRSEIVQSEVFGPVLTVSPFRDEREAIALGNDVSYGLAASVWTKDLDKAMRFAKELEFGTVWINNHLTLLSEAGHGGFKQSGFGKDLSVESMREYQITKHIAIASYA